MTTGDNEGFSGFMKSFKKTHEKDIPQVWYRSKGLLRPVSNFVLLLATETGSTVA